MRKFSHYLRLVWADLRYDRVSALCQALAVAAVLVPLMVLLGLRAGVIGTLIDRMDRDPAMRLILPDVTGANRFDDAWFARWRARPDVAFVLPNTRAIAAQVDLITAAGAELRVALNPTAAGDPLGVGEAVVGPDQIGLTQEAARRLSVGLGDRLTIRVERSRAGKLEPLVLPVTVAALVPPERAGGAGAYVVLPRLLALQAFRDGFSLPELGVTEGVAEAPPVSAHPLFRLYARSIRDVASIAEALRLESVQPTTREGEIQATLNLDANLRAVLAIIVTVAAVGVAVSLIAGQMAALQRKRRDLAVLKLIGYGPFWLAALPVGHVLAVAMGGLGLGLGFYAVAAGAINHLFAASLAAGETACRLPFELGLLVALATGLVALPAGGIAGWRAARVDPAEEIRDV